MRKRAKIQAGKIGFSVLAGGLLLGAVLGAYADPVMKRAPEPWWQLTGRNEVALHEPAEPAWASSENRHPSGYRPDLDYAAEITDWSPRYPRWAYSEFGDGAWDGHFLPYQELGADEGDGERAGETPPQPVPDAEAAESPRTDAAQGAPRGHRVAAIQSDGLW